MPNSRLDYDETESVQQNYDSVDSSAQADTRKPDLPRTKSMNDVDYEEYDEHTALLSASDVFPRKRHNKSGGTTPGQGHLSRISSHVGSLRTRKSTRTDTWGYPSYPSSPLTTRTPGLRTPKLHQSVIGSLLTDDRVWYDQFTSTDWVHDSIADGYRVLRLRRLRGWRGRLRVWFDSIQGWILVLLVGILTACIAYFIDIADAAVFDVKRGFCTDRPWLSHKQCCLGTTSCARWQTWSEVIKSSKVNNVLVDYIAFVIFCVAFACVSCAITLLSKTVVPSEIAATFDENLAATKHQRHDSGDTKADIPFQSLVNHNPIPPSIYYSAAGSGVAEVKVILSGFVLHGYLGARTLFLKVAALIFSVSSGMSLGKEVKMSIS